MDKKAKFFISKDNRRNTLHCFTEWSLEIEAACRGKRIRRLNISWQSGQCDLSFLSHLPLLEEIHIRAKHIKSFSPLRECENLRELHLYVKNPPRLELKNMDSIRALLIDPWKSAAYAGIFNCKSIRSLWLFKFRDNPSLLGGLENLSSLLLCFGSLKNLEAFQEMPSLRKLQLVCQPQLISLNGLKHFSELERLHIQRAKRLVNINALRLMSRLYSVALYDIGTIPSLQPVAKMAALEDFAFSGSSNVKDGIWKILLGSPHKIRIRFQNRIHYSHKHTPSGEIKER